MFIKARPEQCGPAPHTRIIILNFVLKYNLLSGCSRGRDCSGRDCSGCGCSGCGWTLEPEICIITVNMLIDFHTHFFPDNIAKESCDMLAKKSGVTYYGDGTLASLLKFMKEDGVDISVNAPVATKPGQVASINRKMVEINRAQKSVICYGTMHPDFDGFEEEISFLARNGVKGVKMHPEYQGFCPEEKRMLGIFEACAVNGLPVLLHSGADLGYDTIHCKPAGIKKILDIKGLTLILAHMGAYRMWDEVEKLLVGEDVYFDLAYCAEMDSTQLKRMILNHGSDKVLFATDWPWERASVIKKKIGSLGLSSDDIDNITFRNASKLLDIRL